MFIAFRLKRGRDDDLIAWLDSVGEGDRSYHIREALKKSLYRQALPLSAVKIEPKRAEDKKPVKVDIEKNFKEWF